MGAVSKVQGSDGPSCGFIELISDLIRYVWGLSVLMKVLASRLAIACERLFVERRRPGRPHVTAPPQPAPRLHFAMWDTVYRTFVCAVYLMI